MKRRNFVKTASLSLSVPFFLGGNSVKAFGRESLLTSLLDQGTFEDRVLVLVQLNGGNDGLNTLVPLDQYANLFKARENVILPEASLNQTKLNDTSALHPIMTGWKDLYDTEKLGVIQSVGYPNPNFSHFRSTDIWTSATDSEIVDTTGWMGRYFKDHHPAFPEGYPNETHPDPLAITIGNRVSQTCQGPSVNLGMAITNLNPTGALVEQSLDNVDSRYANELNFLRLTMAQTNQYNAVIQTAASNVEQNRSDLYPDTKLADELRIVARLIAGGLKTKLYIVDLGGFDTHANQVDGVNSPDQAGAHFELLKNLSESVHAFQDDIEKLGLADRVLGMTFSEFGRRIGSNDSNGTDHGAAAPLFLFGSKVNPQLLGTNPIIPDEVAVKDNLPMQFDFRSVYGSVLHQWFGAPEEEVSEYLFGSFENLPILKNEISTSIETGIKTQLTLGQNYPNPFFNTTRIPVVLSQSRHIKISVYDAIGREMKVLLEKRLGAGPHEIPLDGSDLKPGTYYYRLQTGHHQEMKAMLKH